MLIILALVAGLGLIAFGGLARAPLCQPIEGLNGDVARSMIDSGDWCVPHHNGCIYADKPPLFYWVTAIGLRLFGDTEFGARFGLALVGLAEVGLVYLLGRLLYGRTAGLLAAVVLATSVGHLIFTRLMMVDVTFSTCLTAAMLCFALGYVQERRRFLWWALAGAAAGLAVLTKSLIGTVFPFLIIGLFLLVTRQWRLLKHRAVAGALLGFLVTVLPWHLYMILRVPGFAYCYFWNEQVLRFLNRREPLDFHSISLPAFFVSIITWSLPWSLFLPHVVWFHRRRTGGNAPVEQLATWLPWLWFGSVVGFFALVQGRLFYYSLPAMPAFALLAAACWKELTRQDGKWCRRTLAFTMLSVALAAAPILLMLPRLAGPAVPESIIHHMMPHAIGIGSCMAIAGIVGTVAILRRRYRLAFAALAGAMLVNVIPITGTFAAFARYVSLGPLIPAVRELIAPGDVVVHRFVRDDNSELPFYLGRPVRILKRPGEFHQPILGEANGYYIEEDEFDRLWRSQQPVFLWVSQPALREQSAEPLPPGATILARDLDACVCCNPPAARRLAADRKAPPFVGTPSNQRVD